MHAQLGTVWSDIVQYIAGLFLIADNAAHRSRVQDGHFEEAGTRFRRHDMAQYQRHLMRTDAILEFSVTITANHSVDSLRLARAIAA